MVRFANKAAVSLLKRVPWNLPFDRRDTARRRATGSGTKPSFQTARRMEAFGRSRPSS